MVTYNYSQADKDFIYDLAKVGNVNLLSSQVVLSPTKEGFRISNAFPDSQGMKLPENWSIEYIHSGSNGLSITFKVKTAVPYPSKFDE